VSPRFAFYLLLRYNDNLVQAKYKYLNTLIVFTNNVSSKICIAICAKIRKGLHMLGVSE
jgi:hypothetical protein